MMQVHVRFIRARFTLLVTHATLTPLANGVLLVPRLLLALIMMEPGVIEKRSVEIKAYVYGQTILAVLLHAAIGTMMLVDVGNTAILVHLVIV